MVELSCPESCSQEAPSGRRVIALSDQLLRHPRGGGHGRSHLASWAFVQRRFSVSWLARSHRTLSKGREIYGCYKLLAPRGCNLFTRCPSPACASAGGLANHHRGHDDRAVAELGCLRCCCRSSVAGLHGLPRLTNLFGAALANARVDDGHRISALNGSTKPFALLFASNLASAYGRHDARARQLYSQSQPRDSNGVETSGPTFLRCTHIGLLSGFRQVSLLIGLAIDGVSGGSRHACSSGGRPRPSGSDHRGRIECIRL